MNSSRLNQAGRIPRAARGAGVALLVAELCLTVQFLTVLSLTVLSLTVLSLTVLWPGSVLAYDNYGLGPLTIRNQFPPSLKYLSYHPETTQTIGEGLFQFSYQFNRTNTFINSQSPRLKRNKQSGIIIDQDVVEAGLDASNFPANGYGMYLDMEADLNMFRFTYGLGERNM
ncbi:MAG: hypothetical protein OEZ59_12430, partial [Deltaproteobacteria bacterium]|nr:hypothetical protein [Deltaproteobacteria bacterium]